MNGRLIVIEGLDGSGKATQAARLTDALNAQGKDVKQISFPDYASDSSALIKMYLGGKFEMCIRDRCIAWVVFTIMLVGWVMLASLSTSREILGGQLFEFASGFQMCIRDSIWPTKATT